MVRGLLDARRMRSLAFSFAVLLLGACGGSDDDGPLDPPMDAGTMADARTETDARPPPPPPPPPTDGSVETDATPPPPDACTGPGCFPPPPPPPLGVRCDVTGAFTGAATDDTFLGQREGTDAFVAWTDGQDVDYVWGFQGGTMLQPVIRVDAPGETESEICLQVQLEHRFAGVLVGEHDTGIVFTRQADGTYDSDVLNDSYEQTEPDGTPLQIVATVRGATFAVTETLTVNPYEM